MAQHPWAAEMIRIAALCVAALFVSLFIGGTVELLLACLVGYLVWHLFQLYRLQHWLQHGKRYAPSSQVSGIWGQIFGRMHDLRRRHRKRKRKLSAILERFKSSTAAMPDATVVLDKHGRIEWFNDAAVRLLGLKPANDVGQVITNLVRNPTFVDYFSGEQYEEHVEIVAPHDPNQWLSVRVVPYGSGQRLLIARDITQLYHLEMVRKDFVANASHELRTPLTVVRGYIETIRDSQDECALAWEPLLGQIENQTARMQRIIEDLLMLSRLEAEQERDDIEKQSVVDVPRLLEVLAEDARRLSGAKQHHIELQADHGVLLRGDEEQLRSAFSNLINNAVQYTPVEGFIEIDWYQDDQGVHLTVNDTGEGIPAKEIPRITERFYRVDVARSRRSGGTGLGLAIVKHALSRHGATLRIDSVVGQGSTFYCDFPIPRKVDLTEAEQGQESRMSANEVGIQWD